MRVFEKDVHLLAPVVSWIIDVCHSRVDNDNVLLLMFVKIVSNLPHPREGKPVGIDGKTATAVIVINVRPHSPATKK